MPPHPLVPWQVGAPGAPLSGNVTVQTLVAEGLLPSSGFYAGTQTYPLTASGDLLLTLPPYSISQIVVQFAM